jgi:hypothetical protein
MIAVAKPYRRLQHGKSLVVNISLFTGAIGQQATLMFGSPGDFACD